MSPVHSHPLDIPARHPVAILLLTGVAILLGILAFVRLPVNLMPDIV